MLLEPVTSDPFADPPPADTPALSASTEAAFYRHILTVIADGAKDGGELASLALACPSEGQAAHDAYLKQEKRVVDLTQEFLSGPREDTGALEKEMDKLLRMRGLGSRPSTPVKDARGSRRKR